MREGAGRGRDAKKEAVKKGWERNETAPCSGTMLSEKQPQ